MDEIEFFGEKGTYVAEWDCFLTTSNNFKDEVLSGDINFPPEIKSQIPFAHLPRFLWRNILKLDSDPFFELLADATEGKNALPFIAGFIYSTEDIPHFTSFAENADKIRSTLTDGSLANFLINFFNNVTNLSE